MFSWLTKQMIARDMKALRGGDVEPSLRLDADDVRFTFPGGSSFAPGARGKPELREWLKRFAAVGLQIYPDEVILKGFPWRQTVCVRGHIHLDTPADGRVYDNRYVIWGRIAWGKMREYEVYEDTEETRRLDEYLAARGEAPAG